MMQLIGKGLVLHITPGRQQAEEEALEELNKAELKQSVKFQHIKENSVGN